MPSSRIARRVLEELVRHRALPPATVRTNTRMRGLGEAWMAIDAAVAPLHETRMTPGSGIVPHERRVPTLDRGRGFDRGLGVERS